MCSVPSLDMLLNLPESTSRSLSHIFFHSVSLNLHSVLWLLAGYSLRSLLFFSRKQLTAKILSSFSTATTFTRLFYLSLILFFFLLLFFISSTCIYLSVFPAISLLLIHPWFPSCFIQWFSIVHSPIQCCICWYVVFAYLNPQPWSVGDRR